MIELTHCDELERQYRLDVCKKCEKFKIEPSFTTSCDACACSIAYLISFNQNSCPLNKWETNDTKQ